MNYFKFFKISLLTASVMVIVGCLGDNTSSSTVKSETVKTVPVNAIDSKTGAISEDITIDIGEKEFTETSINISEGTQFIDSTSSEVITQVPKIKVVVENDFKKSSTEISFTTTDNVKVVPTEPVTVSVVAPRGALSGERVEVILPNLINDSKRLEKVIFITVKADGTIDVVIAEDLFQGLLVVIIRRESRSTN
jgi:hypothetical protein